jgi:putative membrane protein
MYATSFLADTDYGHHMTLGAGWWMWLWGPLMMIGFVLLAVFLVRGVAGRSAAQAPSAPDPMDQARSLLAERYARGELSSDEYDERRSRIDDTSSS